ncbi:MAG: aconitase X catalytic domain-containing protein [Proteobacteria bacterium]|nr:aconitase X catalytic domain-containing protein [Pseudomonadota bacterium]MBU4382728.1 aconitase X catalytic domain-containing protein [Pseudomonadota bacterium]MCG2765242.1 aconitase X catalytic domain-containing protein [Desulfarculaceae bacterium]
MKLTDEDKKLLDGHYGPGARRSMKLLVQWGELFGADRMVDVDHAHLSSSFPTEAVKEFSDGMDRVRATTTLHSVYNPRYWRENLGIVLKKLGGGYGTVDENIFEERMSLLRSLNILPTYTCSPYTIGFIPKPGDVLCYTGSSGTILSNSFFGARAGRESVSTSFAAAVTGRTPLMGLLKKENRYADLVFKVDEDLKPESFSEADYGALGYYIGGVAGPKNVAIEGLPGHLTLEQARMLVSPMPVSGACVMCHVVGATPEAATLSEAVGDNRPETIAVTRKQMRESYEALNTADSSDLDMVVIGCPHLTINEIDELASLLEGKKVHPDVTLAVGISRPTYTMAQDAGYAQVLEKAGATLVNSCIGALNPFCFLEGNPRVAAATNSVRGAHYMQRMSGGVTKTLYGDIKKCARAAITRKWEA